MEIDSFNLIKDLIIRHIDFLIMLGHIGMLCWVSATVFCFKLIITLQQNRPLIESLKIKVPIGIFVSAFILSIILFGFTVSFLIMNIEKETLLLMQEISNFKIYDIHMLFFTIHVCYIFGTTTFIIFFIIWLFLWLKIDFNYDEYETINYDEDLLEELYDQTEANKVELKLFNKKIKESPITDSYKKVLIKTINDVIKIRKTKK